MPASRWRGASATTICIVEQLGLAMIPLWESRASGLTSLTTSGTSSFIRQREELSITTAPWRANTGAHSPEVPPPAENSATSKPAGGVLAEALDDETALELATHRALGGEGDDLAGGELAFAQQAQHQRAHLPGGSHDRDPIALAHLGACRVPTRRLPSLRALRP